MKSQELRQLSKEELSVRLREAREKLYHAKEAVMSGKEKNHAELMSFRREVARICTILANHS
jgi:large subunit ribosomal protein L29